MDGASGSSAGPSQGSIHLSSPTVARDARNLLALARLTHHARLQQQQIEDVRCILGGLVQTPIISQAMRAQELDLKLTARRHAFVRGAAYADAVKFKGARPEDLVEELGSNEEEDN